MGKVSKTHRHNSIKQSARRHEKIKKLRAKYLMSDPKSKEIILQKLKKINSTPSVIVKPK